jgi:DNA-binding beta-propeller fold protein YncE
MINSRIRFRSVCFISMASLALSLIGETAKAQRPPDREYFVYLVCESADQIAVVRFGPEGARLDHTLHTGMMPADINGPHGLVFSPDKKTYFVSLGHGRPFGTALKYRTSDDSVVGQVTLGLFPATMDVTPDGNFLYVVNFNLHGDMVPSSVSIVDTDSMVEVARVKTCTMPHGSRINPQGTRQYSACMMDDMLVEIDTSALKVSRHFVVTRGKELGMTGAPETHRATAGSMKEMPGHGEAPAPGDDSCSPTWAQPSSDGSSIFVACNKSSDIVQVDTASWKMVRRIAAGPGVYNLAVTRDGRLLVATNKRGPSVSVFDAKSGKELARLPTKRKVVHGVVVSPDSRYAFVSVEGVGSEPGTVEVIDLESLKTVATIDVPVQAAGIDFWKMEK